MKYYIIAGEASGDLHGANLMRAIMAQDSEAEIRFWGGDAMHRVGGADVKGKVRIVPRQYLVHQYVAVAH